MFDNIVERFDVRAEAGAAVINDEKRPQVTPPAISPWSALLTCPDLAPQWFNAAVVMATLGLFDIRDEADISIDLDVETYVPYVYLEWEADPAQGIPAHGLRCDADGAYTVISYGDKQHVETIFSAPSAVDLLLRVRKMREQ